MQTKPCVCNGNEARCFLHHKDDSHYSTFPCIYYISTHFVYSQSVPVKMAQGAQLMDLSEEPLLEIAARVPYDASNWLNLSLVNHRFNAVMAIDTLPAKAAKVQYSVENILLPPNQNPLKRLRECSTSSEYTSSCAARLCEGRNTRHLMKITMLLLTLMEPESWRPSQAKMEELGVNYYFLSRVFYFSTLRLLPSKIHDMIRYFTIQAFQQHALSSRVSSMLFLPSTSNPQEKGKWLQDVATFLRFEEFTAIPQFTGLETGLSDKNFSSVSDVDNELVERQCYTPLAEGIILPIIRAGRGLLSAEMLMDAAKLLETTPYKVSLAHG